MKIDWNIVAIIVVGAAVLTIAVLVMLGVVPAEPMRSTADP
jgi:hypothetical protein